MRVTGKIVRLPLNDAGRSRGFFFIRVEDGSNRDFFGHMSELKGDLVVDELQIDQELTFTPVHDPRGWRAHDIERSGR